MNFNFFQFYMGMQKIVRCKPLILIQDFLDKYVDFLTYIFQEPALEGGFSNFMELLSSSSPVSLRLSTSTQSEKARGRGPCLGADRKRVSRRDMSGEDRKRVTGGTCQERIGRESGGGQEGAGGETARGKC